MAQVLSRIKDATWHSGCRRGRWHFKCRGVCLLHTSIPMGILPLGTFNYVERVLNIPLDLMAAAK